MRKFSITWDSGYDDGETVVSAESASAAETAFSRKFPDREVISVNEM